MASSAVTEPKPNVYENMGKGADKLFQKGRLGFRKVQELIKTHDATLYPIALVAIAVTLLFVNFLSSIFCFAAGAFYFNVRGDQWKEGIIQPVTELWEGSTVGKIAVFAFFIFVIAPYKWHVAAFGFGIHIAKQFKE